MSDLRQAAFFALTTLQGWSGHDHWLWPESALAQAKQNTAEAISLLEAALAQPGPEEPVVGELVVVAHWGDFDYPMDAVRLGRLRETQEQDGKTYYYVDDLCRGFRHCRTLTPRVLPVKEAANASITTPSTLAEPETEPEITHDGSSNKLTAKELQSLWQACNSPSVFARAVLARWGK